VLEEVANFIEPGITTLEVDEFAAERMKFYKAKSAFFGIPEVFRARFAFRSTNRSVHGLGGARRLEFVIL